MSAEWCRKRDSARAAAASSRIAELLHGQLIEVRVGNADVADLRAHVRDLDRRPTAELALKRDVPLLRVAGPERTVHAEDTLTQAGRRCGFQRSDARTVLENERRIDGVERPLGHRLKKRKRRRRERRRDPRHFDPHETVARS